MGQTNCQGLQGSQGRGRLALCPIQSCPSAWNSYLTISHWNKGRAQEGGSTSSCHSLFWGHQRCV